jgi:hypothetical protein
MEIKTFEDARKAGLDVFTFANNDAGEAARLAHTVAARVLNRSVVEFTETIAGTTLLCLGVGPRPDSGKIAKYVKNRKTAREFIQGE